MKKLLEYAERRRRAVEVLAAHRVNGLLVTALPNVRYLSGFTGSNGLLLLLEGSATLYTDPRYSLQGSEETDCRVVTAKRSLHEAAMAGLRKRRGRIGLERNRLSLAAYLELVEHAPAGVRLEPLGPIVERLRMVKSESEIELTRRSVDTNSRAFEKALAQFKAGWRESELAAEIEYQMRRFGAEGAAFETIVASGARSALPHARPTAEAIRTNRLLLMDTGAFQAGYASDMTRMAHVGTPGPKARKLYGAVLEAQLAAVDAVREGVAAGAVDRAARRVLRKHGLEREFMHSTGHGVGLEIHEGPRIGRSEKERLATGMVITIEPGAYVQGFGGVRIEDTVLVKQNGCEILTPTSKDLRVI